MHLRKHDLLQMDDEWLKKLPAELLLEVSKRLLHDVKELQDRLNESPTNSSRPPTSRAPWEKPRDPAEGKDAPAETDPLAWIVHRQGDKCDNRMIECLFSLKQSVKNRSRHSPCC